MNTDVKRNIEASSRNPCCRGIAINIRLHIVSMCVSVALVIQHAKCMRRFISIIMIIICGLSGPTIS
jgi:hypothetical protein